MKTDLKRRTNTLDWADPSMSCRLFVFHCVLSFQKMDLPAACVEDFEGKINKSKLKLVLTNGKIQGYDWALSTTVLYPFCTAVVMEFSVL